MKRLFFLLKFLIWAAVLVVFFYNPGKVRIQWLNYDIQTSVFFLFAAFLIVDVILRFLGRIDRFLFSDLSKNIKISHYQSEIKSLKKAEQKRLEKEEIAAAKAKQQRADKRREKWHQRGQWVKSLFRK